MVNLGRFSGLKQKVLNVVKRAAGVIVLMLFSVLASAQTSPFFFFQAEDGIRYLIVTGVQTCALPIFNRSIFSMNNKLSLLILRDHTTHFFSFFLGGKNARCTVAARPFHFPGSVLMRLNVMLIVLSHFNAPLNPCIDSSL